MAFIGVVVGAGFASGQEAMQYFVAFGNWGLWGIALAAGLMMITGISILQLGSYFQAEEHTAVYDKVASPFTAKILDWSTLVTLFAIGFVMFAGGGANINQQFPSIPVWVGATAMLILVLLVGLMDVDRVTAVIGTITPFIIIFVVVATGYTILNADVDFSAMNDWAVNNVDTSLPNWWLAALNYTGLNVMTAVSMSIVIGGNFLDNRAVGIGGLIGGLLYLILLALLVFALFFEAETVNGQDMPVLSLITSIHPVLGVLMTFVIYGMVFNTAIGMFYALGRRLTADRPGRYRPVFAGVTLLAFAVSFVGFGDLMNVVYPALGHLGIVLALVLLVWWLTHRRQISAESGLRLRLLALLRLREHPEKTFTAQHAVQLQEAVGDSVAAPDAVTEALEDEVAQVLEEDDALTSGGARPGPDAGPERPAGGSHSA